MKDTLSGALEIAEKLIGKEVVIATDEPGVTFKGRLIEFDDNKAVIEKTGSGERIKIETSSITSIGK